ncbi:hypothetical protein F0B90_07505 [Salmonella enterica]|uniref:Uncharacterized protein n=1 Tax=Salmonella enterica TaxID=28901 RepID=A0A5Y8LG31_SALER|nr:hypothetical protein [Salmonella enterica]
MHRATSQSPYSAGRVRPASGSSLLCLYFSSGHVRFSWKQTLTFRYGKQRQTLANRCKSLHYYTAIYISFSYIFSIFNRNKV